MNVDLGRVVKFFYVAEGKSFIHAAEKLHVDQTWLSRQIQQLEVQLGCLLLERTTRYVKLTPAGEELFAAAKQLAEAGNKANSVATSLERKKSRELCLGISSSTFWIPARESLRETFQSRYRDMTITTVFGNTTELIEKLHQRSIDVAITGMVREAEEFDYITIYKGKPLLFVPSESHLATKDVLHMSDVKGLKIVIPTIDNVHSFKAIYQPFLDAGAVPHRLTEGVFAAMHYAVVKRVCMIAWGFENAVSNSLTLREIRDCEAINEVVALRNKDDERRSVRSFWSTAQLMKST